MKIIVCGGRTYGHAQKMREVLSALPNDTVIVHGGAPGADSLAATIGKELGMKVVEMHADWAGLGKKAGPIRNQAMVDAGADRVFAFPGGRGTFDLCERAQRAGIRVDKFDTEYAMDMKIDAPTRAEENER